MQDISQLTLSELEEKLELVKCFRNLASVSADAGDLHAQWTEMTRLIENEILERTISNYDGTAS